MVLCLTQHKFSMQQFRRAKVRNSRYKPMQIILFNKPTKAISTFKGVDMTTIIGFRRDSILIIFLHYRRQEKRWIDQIFCSTTEVAEAALRLTADVPTSQRKFLVYAAALMQAVYHSPWVCICNYFGGKMELTWSNVWEIDQGVSKWWCQGHLNTPPPPHA